MTNEELIELVNFDLRNEYKHLHFYLQASVMLRGLHREELSEFLLKEANNELVHCEQFARLVVHLGGTPMIEINDFPTDLTCPVAILKYARDMEREVAENYAERMRQTEAKDTSATAYAHVFYEAQIEDSWKSGEELHQMVFSWKTSEELRQMVLSYAEGSQGKGKCAD